MKNNKSLLSHAVKAGIFTLTILSASQVQAESQPIIPVPLIDDLYVKADLDNNGQISVDEHYGLHTARKLLEYEAAFKAMDENGDGLVESQEFMNFLPVVEESMIKQQFQDAAGDDEALNSEEFSVMRLEEQGVNNDSLWEFALLDADHNGQLDAHEFNNVLVEPPPVIMDGPAPVAPPPGVVDDSMPVIEPPPVIMDGPAPVAPPPIVMDGQAPIAPPPGVVNDSETVIAPPPVLMDGPAPVAPPPIVMDGQAPIAPPPGVVDDSEAVIAPPPVLMDGPAPVTVPTDPNMFVGPLQPADSAASQVIEVDQTNELQEKLDRLDAQLVRLNKSILMTEKRIGTSTSEKKVARLERRLKRQQERLGKLQDLYQMTVKELGEAQ